MPTCRTIVRAAAILAAIAPTALPLPCATAQEPGTRGAVAPTAVPAQAAPPKARVALRYGAQRQGRREDPAMNRWREDRLGAIFHFGLYSLAAGSWGGKECDCTAEFIKTGMQVPDADYDALMSRFDPAKESPARWVAMAKEMGARYVILTAKHHDGFCLWPSDETDYDVASTPYREDLVGQFVQAAKDAGLDVLLYYSILDWHHPDWRGDLRTDGDRAAFARYWGYATRQCEELLRRYPSVMGLWFDGTWDDSVKSNGQLTLALEQRLRAIKPDVLVGSRLRADDKGARHFDSNGLLMGDWEQGWERKLPRTPPANDWECVMTVPENGWGYQANWKGHLKDTHEVLEMAARCVAMGGNFVLNFGPMGNGGIRPEEQALARGIGDWMRANGDAIAGCGLSGLPKIDWGWWTKKPGSTDLNAIVFNLPLSGALPVVLPRNQAPESATIVGGDGAPLRIEATRPGEWLVHLGGRTFTQPFTVRVKVKQAG
jgi:alpha-L-fucosidase